EIKIRRISRFDIKRQQKEIKTIEKEIRLIRKHLKDMIGFTVNYLQSLLEEFGDQYPRRSEIHKFDEVDAREAAYADLEICYQRQSGFLGHKVEIENEKEDRQLVCSEYDKILIIYRDGRYKVVNIPEKLFIGSDINYLEVIKKDVIFNIIYKNGIDGYIYAKRFVTPKYIINREYRLIPEHKNSSIQLLKTGKGVMVRLGLAPSARARYNSLDISLDDYLIKGAAAKGKRLTNRTVRRISDITGKKPKEDSIATNLPGFQNKKE
ncbi:MAG: DNA topoisomerase IV subunit A, partial [Desulfobulbaceae bacterium]|nr:DNA topoisomerase IV subunit A [Desulfobulbaceae bacterium]